MTDPEPRGYVPSPGTPLVTQANHWQWQHRAARALAAILNHQHLPAITWTLTPTGSLAGQVNGVSVPADQVRATYTAWQHALGIHNVKETPIRDTGVTALTGRTYHGTVLIGLTTRIHDPDPGDTDPAEPHAAVPARQGKLVPPSPGRRESAPGGQPAAPAPRTGRVQAGPLISPPSPGGSGPVQSH